jgi:hypothetical protein
VPAVRRRQMADKYGEMSVDEMTVQSMAQQLVVSISSGIGMVPMPDDIAKNPGEALDVFVLNITTIAGNHRFLFGEAAMKDLVAYSIMYAHDQQHAAEGTVCKHELGGLDNESP